MAADRKSLGHGIKLCQGFEAMLCQQTGPMVQLAVKATTSGMGHPEMERMLQDLMAALTFARASGMMFLAYAKAELGDLDLNEEGVKAELAELDEQRELLLEQLTKEQE